ncbi:MAG: hypothetical protein ACPGSM_12950 [Thiolinea sp.]
MTMKLKNMLRDELIERRDELSELLGAVMQSAALLNSSQHDYVSNADVLQVKSISRTLQARKREIDGEIQERQDRISEYSQLTVHHRADVDCRIRVLAGTIRAGEGHVLRKRSTLMREGITEEMAKNLIPDFDAAPIEAEIDNLQAKQREFGKFFHSGRLVDLPELPNELEAQAA